MPFSEALAARVRDAFARTSNVTEQKMFGGLCFLLNRSLVVGVWNHSLIVRLGPDRAETAVRKSHVERMVMGGRPMKGWVVVDPEGVDTDRQILSWIRQATEFVETLPAKSKPTS